MLVDDDQRSLLNRQGQRGFQITRKYQVGAFFGGRLCGLVYDRTGSYDLVWCISIVLSVLAAVLHWPIAERSVERILTVGGIGASGVASRLGATIHPSILLDVRRTALRGTTLPL